MPSSKKMRARQRKAAKMCEQFSTSYLDNFSEIPPSTVVDQVRRGLCFPIMGLFGLKPFDVAKDMEYQQRLVDAGLIEVLIGLLSRGENEELSNIMGGGDERNGPWAWVCLLDRFSIFDKSRALGIVSNNGLQPLMRCMCNYHKREFFKSNILWYQSVGFFIDLVRTMMENREAAGILLQHEDLLKLIIQSIFWDGQPDMVKNIEHTRPHHMLTPSNDAADPMELIGNLAVQTICNIVSILTGEKDEGNLLKKEAKRLLQYIGKTPVPDNMHGHTHKIPFVVALLNSLKSTKYGARRRFLNGDMITCLIMADCVDKEVITGVIDYGLNFMGFGDPDIILVTTLYMLSVNEGKPHDARFAFAVQAGLFEMVLKLIPDCKGRDDSSWADSPAKEFSELATHASLLKHTSAAIQEHSDIIWEVIQQSETLYTESSIYQGVVAVIQSILDINARNREYKKPICYHCQQDLESKYAMHCSKCEIVTYCSRECQVDNWQEHKNMCKKLIHHRKDHDVMPFHVSSFTRQKLQRVGNMLFEQYMSVVFMLSILDNYDILDCVVEIDLGHAPPKVDTKHHSHFFSISDEMNESSLAEKQQFFYECRSNGFLTQIFSMDYVGPNLEVHVSSGVSIMQESCLYPWQDKQRELKESMVSELMFFEENLEAKDSYIEYLKEYVKKPEFQVDDLDDICTVSIREFIGNYDTKKTI